MILNHPTYGLCKWYPHLAALVDRHGKVVSDSCCGDNVISNNDLRFNLWYRTVQPIEATYTELMRVNNHNIYYYLHDHNNDRRNVSSHNHRG